MTDKENYKENNFKNSLKEAVENLQKTRKYLNETVKNLNASNQNLNDSLHNLKGVHNPNNEISLKNDFKAIPSIEETSKQIENIYEYLFIDSFDTTDLIFIKKNEM